MKLSDSIHAKAQRRKDIPISQPLFFRVAPLRLCVILLLVIFAVPATSAQEVADTIKVRTRVVFLDALVKEKKTGVPISDLKPENFEVFDDGKPREISYFTSEGQARKPLALILILDLRDDGAGRFLKREEVRQAMVEELAKLPPGDEVAILAINLNSVDDKAAAIRNGKAIWLTEFTRDRAQLQTALARVPSLVATPPEPSKTEKSEPKDEKKETSMTVSASSDKNEDNTNNASKTKIKENDVLETETIRGENGAVITRTTKKDGSVDIKRVSSNGKMTIQLDNFYDMAGATRDATHLVEEKRPNSQASIVWLSDGIAPIFFEDRDATEKILIRSNVIFNSLTVDLRTLFKFVLPLAKPVGTWMGMSLYGGAKRLAQQSGGEAVRVNRAKDYGTGLGKIIGNLTARYSLGFSLAENEKDDGRLHNLDVRVKAQDAKGKTRKLLVSSRQGYYMSNATDKDATASKAQ